MKLNLLATALAGFLTSPSHAHPTPEALQLSLFVEVPQPAQSPPLALLVFQDTDVGFNGQFYTQLTTVDGTEFFLNQPTVNVDQITVNGVAVCTVVDSNGKSYVAPSTGPPNTTIINLPAVFVNGSCVPPTGKNTVKLDL